MEKLIGTVLDGRYEILSLIGVGGMAYVYKAKCRRLDRFVAIKTLKPEYTADYDVIKRFKNESNAVARLSHNNIVNVYDVSSDKGIEYMVMELIEGIPFKQYLTNKGKLTWEEAGFFIIQIAEALEHAHSRGIIHQDIKPHNIMLMATDGTLKVADFGIAKLESENETKVISEAIGSLHYVSPEQAKGNKIDLRTDIYSLGVVMYEMLTGKVPYEGDTAVAIVMQHINGMPVLPTSISDIPKAVEEIILKAMSPYVENRYANARELITAVQSVQENPNMIFGYPLSENEETRLLDEQLADHINNRINKKKRNSLTSPAIIFPFILVIAIALAATYYIYNNIFSNKTDEVFAPSLVQSDINYVSESEIYEKYNIVIVEEIYSDEPEGTILKQEPVQGSKLTSTSTIYVTVSLGQKLATIPDVSGYEDGKAELELKRLGFTTIKIYEFSEDVEKGQVIRTTPEIFEEVKITDTVVIYVSSGKEIELTTMPNLFGRTLEEAGNIIIEAKLVLGDVTFEESLLKEGTVIDQGSKANTDILTESAIDLVVAIPFPEVNTPQEPESQEDDIVLDEKEEVFEEEEAFEEEEFVEEQEENVEEEVPEEEPVVKSAVVSIAVPSSGNNIEGVVFIEVFANKKAIYQKSHSYGDSSFNVTISGSEPTVVYVYADGEVIGESVIMFN